MPLGATRGSLRRCPRPAPEPAPAPLLARAGLVVPMVHELRETRHQFACDWVLDAGRAERTFGLAATPLAEGARRTIETLLRRAPVAVR